MTLFQAIGLASAVHHFRRGAVRLRMAAGVGLASAGAVGLVSGAVVTQPWYDATAFQLLFAGVLLVLAGPAVLGAQGAAALAVVVAGRLVWNAVG